MQSLFQVEGLLAGVNLQAELPRQLCWFGRSLPWSCSSAQRKTCLDTWPFLFVTHGSVSPRLSVSASSRLHLKDDKRMKKINFRLSSDISEKPHTEVLHVQI